MADILPTNPGAGPTFRERLIAEIPNLRAFAASLSGSMQMADDLVQDSLLKAWSHADSFAEGTNMRAWLFTILRNTYFSIQRKRGREVQDSAGMHAERMGVAPSQEGVVDLADFRRALAKLSEEQREVLIMVASAASLRGGRRDLRRRRRHCEEPRQPRPQQARRTARHHGPGRDRSGPQHDQHRARHGSPGRRDVTKSPSVAVSNGHARN